MRKTSRTDTSRHVGPSWRIRTGCFSHRQLCRPVIAKLNSVLDKRIVLSGSGIVSATSSDFCTRSLQTSRSLSSTMLNSILHYMICPRSHCYFMRWWCWRCCHSVSTCRPVFENTYFVFFRISKNMTFYGFFWNDVSKSRKKSLAKV